MVNPKETIESQVLSIEDQLRNLRRIVNKAVAENWTEGAKPDVFLMPPTELIKLAKYVAQRIVESGSK